MKREPLTQTEYYDAALEFIEDGDDDDVPYTDLTHYAGCYISYLYREGRNNPYFLVQNYQTIFKLMIHFIDDRLDDE